MVACNHVEASPASASLRPKGDCGCSLETMLAASGMESPNESAAPSGLTLDKGPAARSMPGNTQGKPQTQTKKGLVFVYGTQVFCCTPYCTCI